MRLRLCCLLIFQSVPLAFVAVAADPPAEDKFNDQKVIAQALADSLVKEDFKAACKDFDDVMKKALPPEKLEGTWKGIVGELGAYQKMSALRAEASGKYDVVYSTFQFERSKLDLKVVFNAEKQVTGLFLQPPKIDYKAPSYVKADSFREVEAVVGEGEWALPGTLTVPKGDGPFPAVVLVQGSGPHDRDESIGPNMPFRDLAWGLSSRGIAVLRYEKRTRQHAAKAAALKTLTFKEEVVDDALAATALLRKNKAIDGKRIFVVGHSLGATCAPRIAELDLEVGGIILLAGTTRPLEDVLLEQVAYVLSVNNTPADQQKEQLEKLKEQVKRVKDPKLSPDTPSGDLPLGAPAAYWLALRDYDPAATAAKLKRPMLVLQGEQDYQVTMDDFAGWKKALEERKDVRLRSYPKLNHLFMESERKARPADYEKPGHVVEEVVDDIAKWVKEQ
jgi:dienelactone hydrolase